jgi:hypothetical protein
MSGYKEVESGGMWKPEEVGAKFEGVLKSREVKRGQNDKDYTLFTFEEHETGNEVKVSGSVLENKLAEVPDGARVLLTYKGEQRGKNGNKYKDFSVAVWED